MKSFNITMPEDLLDYVRSRTKAGGFGTPTEFMRHLIRQDRDAQADREVEKRLVAGSKSGRSGEPAEAFFKRMHALIDDVAATKRQSRRSGKAARSSARG